MDWGGIIPLVITGIIAALPGLILALIALKKTPVESEKTEAETKKINAETGRIHAEIAEQWADHVSDLQTEVKGLRLDIAQVRRENEIFRVDLDERDAVIADLQRWAEQLVGQLRIHAPSVVPAEFVRTMRNR